MALILHQKLTSGTGVIRSLDGYAHEWERSIQAIGGFWQGSFTLSEERLSYAELLNFYNLYLGNRLVERTYSLVSWEGLIYEMRMVNNGQEYRRTLDPDWWHDKVKAIYSYPSSEDDEQGNLVYNPVANSFQDDGQDFSDWQTLVGDAVYSITVTNADGTIAWGFLGVDFTTANANDSIYIYTDVEMGTAGWNGEYSAKTPTTYEVRNVVLAGARQDTGWSEDTDSSDEYGVMEYILNLGGTVPEGATALRDRELQQFAFPRSRKVGGGEMGPDAMAPGVVIEVSVAGFWVTLNWIYRATSRVAAASDMINTLVGASEFVTAGRVDTNGLGVKADCDPIPQRLGDLCEIVTAQGDIEKNQWQCGVYADREFVYEASPTSATYFLRTDGKLVDLTGRPVIPQLFRPGVLIKDTWAFGATPVGGSEQDDPRIGYVEEVEYNADRDELRYRIRDQETSVTVIKNQLQSGSFDI